MFIQHVFKMFNIGLYSMYFKSHGRRNGRLHPVKIKKICRLVGYMSLSKSKKNIENLDKARNVVAK